MAILSENFRFLYYFGIWPSVYWHSRSWKTAVYSIYTSYIISSIYWFTISGSIYLLVITDDVEDFSDASFMLLSLLALCAKIVVTISKRSEIVEVIAALENYPYKPVDPDTQMVQDKVDEYIRLCTIIYGGLGEASVCCGTIAPFFQNIPFGFFPYKAWVPYDYSDPGIYWFTFCQQLATVFIAANINIGFDTVVFGLLMQVCAQFKMLKHRLEMIIHEYSEERIMTGDKINFALMKNYEECITECIKSHVAIFRLFDKINSIFSSLIFIQYSVSSIIICSSVLLLSHIPVSSSKFQLIMMYMLCMLSQIFIWCAAGNEATLEGQSIARAIYNTEWYYLTDNMKKKLEFMMFRSMKPIIFVSYHIVVLSLQSFCVLLKTSYTAYTMLQQFSY
ncbi:odorant receptor Or1-like [Fopius arisanus]|uniref:Odorant receptor n=1 Tax=Fopius arisanus TaxID=64838 RepID=A0A9R1U4D4_9HYME|nr:PREDICTED: odorant receptor Or1-like [Fopius arisanus]